jgi:hypothetical protein
MRSRSCGLLLVCLATLAPHPRSTGADDFKLEEGFTPFFNGKDLTGWKMAKGGDSLDGKTEAANKRFLVSDGKLVIDPKVKGDVTINTAKEFGKDVHIKFEFLPGAGCNNDLYFRGLKFDLKKSDVKNLKEDQWNVFEIVLQGDTVEYKCNGESLKTAKATAASTPLGVRAEFGPIQLRHLRYKEAK